MLLYGILFGIQKIINFTVIEKRFLFDHHKTISDKP